MRCLRSFLDDCVNEHKLITEEVKGGLSAGADVSGLGSSTTEYHEDEEDIELEKWIGSLYIVRIGGPGWGGAEGAGGSHGDRAGRRAASARYATKEECMKKIWRDINQRRL